jgi:hypothetical protein
MVYSYPEKTLQLAAVRWMTANWRYLELVGDAEATGDRMDSVGLLGDAPIAIEAKTAVSSSMVRFDGTSSNALEAKIGATIGGLYRGEANPQLAAIRSHWDEITPITVGILAGGYSAEALAQLKTLLELRSRDWWINCVVWLWTGTVVETLFSTQAPQTNFDRHWQRIDVPQMVGAFVKRPSPSLQEIRNIASSKGVAELFEHFLVEIGRRQHRIQCRPTGIAVADPATGRTILAMFLTSSDRWNGINVGVDCERLNCFEDEIPGVPAPRAGFLNTNRFLATKMHVGELLDRLPRPG